MGTIMESPQDLQSLKQALKELEKKIQELRGFL